MQENDSISKRFTELAAAVAQVKTVPSAETAEVRYLDPITWEKWATNVLNFLQGTFGENSIYYKNFHKLYSNCQMYDSELESAKGIFFAAQEDFNGGYIFKLEAQISRNLLGDFVELAKLSLSEDHKDVAAVLASAALEDALKRYALASGLDVSKKNMQEVVNALKGKGLVSGAQKTLLDFMPKIRDYAMHADWKKLSAPDINSVIGFVEQFLKEHFS